MNGTNRVAPGARVRANGAMVGTIEALETRGPRIGDAPNHMIVRADDGSARYSVPLLLVRNVEGDGPGSIVDIPVAADELQLYVIEAQGDTSARAAAVDAGEGQWRQASDDTLRIPLAAEELVTRKESVLLGNVHVHKGVQTEEKAMTVPVHHEEAIVEHIPADQYDPNTPTGPGETIVPIVEEQLIVEKRRVVKEYVRIRKTVVTEQREVRDTVRREFVEVSEQRADDPQGPRGGTSAPVAESASQGQGTTG